MTCHCGAVIVFPSYLHCSLECYEAYVAARLVGTRIRIDGLPSAQAASTSA